jgi:hypothetical protein
MLIAPGADARGSALLERWKAVLLVRLSMSIGPMSVFISDSNLLFTSARNTSLHRFIIFSIRTDNQVSTHLPITQATTTSYCAVPEPLNGRANKASPSHKPNEPNFDVNKVRLGQNIELTHRTQRCPHPLPMGPPMMPRLSERLTYHLATYHIHKHKLDGGISLMVCHESTEHDLGTGKY